MKTLVNESKTKTEKFSIMDNGQNGINWTYTINYGRTLSCAITSDYTTTPTI